ncbi:MAG TPA: 3',5'-cyclic-nucleotide phosphodiesterase [Blastocatellia bacterium]|nr:3',5'-cyclic-nucleotide phosphodiesterase [Blastocatellia bacterium]
MRVRLLPSTIGGKSEHQALTTFLINERLAVDGGSLGLALAPERMAAIRDIVVTHAHSDHTASLPIFIAEAFTNLDGPVTIYGTAEVVSALREFVFNDQVWPDFEKIDLMTGGGPALRFKVIKACVPIEIAGLRIIPVPVNHVVPTIGLVIEDEQSAVALTSDTYSTDEIWSVAGATERLKAVFVDVSYPNEFEPLAAASRHFTPQTLALDLKKLGRQAEIYAVHIKPSNREQVVRELAGLSSPEVRVAEINRVYEW